jgi:PleD family two-component response regulator
MEPARPPSILIVSAAFPALGSVFAQRGFLPTVATDTASALERLARERFDVILLNPVRPLTGGMRVLEQKGTTVNFSTPLILLVSQEQEDLIDTAARTGAWKCEVMQETSPRRLADTIWADLAKA